MKRNNSLPALTVLALLCLLALAACGDIPMKETIVDAAIDYTWVPVSPSPYFKAPTPTAGDRFGYSVDISDSFAVVGAPFNGSNTGAVYIYANNGGTWTYQDTLTAPDGAAGDYFGWAVATTENYIVVGARGDNSNQGGAYLFYFNGTDWVNPNSSALPDNHLPVPSSANQQAGRAVDIYSDSQYGEYVAVGAPYYNGNAGRTYIFHRDYGGENIWGRQSTLDHANSDSNINYYGSSVSLSDDTVIIGAPYDGSDALNSGAVYFHKRTGLSTWAESVKIKAEIPTEDYLFGNSVSIKSGYFIVGEYPNNKAYLLQILSGSDWQRIGEFTTIDIVAGDEFGFAVGISNGYAIIGAHNHNTQSISQAGAAYLIKTSDLGSGTGPIAKNVPVSGDKTGESVAISSDYAIIGIPNDDTPSESGAVLIYKKKRL